MLWLLNLFSAHRRQAIDLQSALSDAQAARESELRWRDLYESAQAKYEALQADVLARERALLDHNIGFREEVTRSQAQVQAAMVEEFREKQAKLADQATNLQQWKKKTQEDLIERLEARRKAAATTQKAL